MGFQWWREGSTGIMERTFHVSGMQEGQTRTGRKSVARMSKMGMEGCWERNWGKLGKSPEREQSASGVGRISWAGKMQSGQEIALHLAALTPSSSPCTPAPPPLHSPPSAGPHPPSSSSQCAQQAANLTAAPTLSESLPTYVTLST